MSTRSILIVVLALVFGGTAAFLVANMPMNGGAPAPKEDQVPVVVVTTDVGRFTALRSDMLKVVNYPKNLLPPGAITRVEDAVDRVVLVALSKDEYLSANKLSARGAGRGIAAAIPRGMRAFTIQTPNVASGVAGFILPGNRVDVLLTINSQGQNDPSGGATTITLLQNLEILAVDQRVEAPVENKVDPNQLRSVTLLVTPEQANQLDLGQNRGTLHLALRNPQDDKQNKVAPATLTGLREGDPPQKPSPIKPVSAEPPKKETKEEAKEPAPPKPAWTIIVEHGSQPPQQVPFFEKDGKLVPQLDSELPRAPRKKPPQPAAPVKPAGR